MISIKLSAVVFGWYVAVSLLTFAFYGWDKRAAKRDRQRVPEQTLHLLALLGGWPGALLGQRMFRHKTSKRRFQVVYWLTVALNCVGLVCLWWIASRSTQ